jgi:hypothetical protein
MKTSTRSLVIIGALLLFIAFAVYGHLSLRDIELALLVFSGITSWIMGLRMRRKIRKDLGREATDLDLASIDTWMKVEEVERRQSQKKPLE